MAQDDPRNPKPLSGGRQRASHIQVHRLELGLKERKYAEALLMTRMYRNVTVGTGTLLRPILNNIQWIIAAIIAKEGLEWFEDRVDMWKQNRIDNQRQYELDAYEAYLATNPDNPMSEEDYTRNVTQNTTSYRRANWWQNNVGDPIRNSAGNLLDALTFWN